jgi:phosphoglycerate dehydrogenase-like enzyme
MRRCRIVFILSAATTENQRGLGKQHFAMMQPGSVVVLAGRADVVDFDALLDAADSGHIRAAIDVFPEEPVPAEHRARKTANTILSGHRSGGLPETYREVGRMVVDELELVLRGLPPKRMQQAAPETVARLRSRPIAAKL